MHYLREVLRIVREEIAAVFAVDLSQVRFERLHWAIVFGSLLLIVFLWKCFSRNTDNLQGSGYFIRETRRNPTWKRIAYASAKPLLFMTSALAVIDLAVPYVASYSQERVIESREVCYLEDISASMGWEFGSSGISSAQVVRDALLRHLQQRRGYSDRSCFWIFAAQSYKIEDFTTDVRSFAFQVYNAPYIAANESHFVLPWIVAVGPNAEIPKVIVPREKILFRDREGGTNLKLVLQKNIGHFRSSGLKNMRRQALVLMTDAAVDEYPAEELDALNRMGVTMYLIYIEPNARGMLATGMVGARQLENAKRLIEEFAKYGGKTFNIRNNSGDRRVLDQVFSEIHKLEPRREEVIQKVEKEYIFQRLLAPAILVCMISILLGCAAEYLWGSRI